MVRTGYGKHATQVDTNTYPDDPSVPIGSDEWNAEPSDSGMLGFNAETIASATTITPSNTVLNVSGSTNISTIAQGNTNEYDLLYIFTSGTVTLEHNTGNLQLISNSNKDLSTTIPTILIRKGTDWVEYGGGGNVTGTVMSGHIIPDTDNTYDIGSAEFKIRDAYVSENSLWVGDNHKVEVAGGKMKFKKRKNNRVPDVITSAGGSEAGAKSNRSRGNLTDMTLNDWVKYARSLGGSLANAKPNDIFKSDDADDWEVDDASVPQQGTAGKILGYNASTGELEEQDAPAGGATEGTMSFAHTTTDDDYTKTGTITFSNFEANDNESAPINAGSWSPNYYSGPTRVSSWNGTTSVGLGNVFVKNITASWSGNVSYNRTYCNLSSMTVNFTDGTSQAISNNVQTLLNKQVNNVVVVANGGYSTSGPQMNFSGNISYTSGNAEADINDENECGTANETNPWIQNDCGNNNLFGADINNGPLNRTTCTQYKVEVWDGSAWIRVRTLGNTLGKMRWNGIYGSKIKITGLDATAKRLSIDKFRIYKKVDADLFNHGHIAISATDSSLGLDGT